MSGPKTPKSPLILRQQASVPIAPKTLDGYIGQYELNRNLVGSVTRDGGRRFAQATGQDRFELYAETDRKFFCQGGECPILF
jgi:hypothetical protein